MSVTEYERHQLFTWFEERMGKERAATLMNLVPPAGWAEVASRRDLDALDQRLTARLDAVDARLATLVTTAELDARLGELEARLEARFEARLDVRFGELAGKFGELAGKFGEFGGTFGEFDGKLGELRSDLLRTFGTWLFASQAAVIAAVSVLVALS